MNAVTLAPSEGTFASVEAPLCPLPTEEFSQKWRRSLRDGSEEVVPWYQRDPAGIVRCPYGIPQTNPGFVSPLGYLDLHEDTPAVMAGCHIAIGLAAASWAQVGGERTTGGRDVVICLTEDACPISDMTLFETLCIAEHELQPARDRVAVRLATDPDFTAKFAQARAIMSAACVYFPWYRGDGKIPG
ncbi:hypothetical protein GCM10011390_48580 [Aureimonas endophytica]|uniref:Uncharacterized protein n=1 Tax=Aureimonas endophytica TaxID=2027858 RepID=A0A917A2L7_9HYPH|nr:hypothetical protein [Aureimonas endophytica]GGE23438.1 hypothetical protein GCM10011390_48580 [Aureimonas endophytica]